MLYCLQDTGTDPYFNVALEEYLLKHTNKDFFRLWRNDNAIVVGKNQNTIGEINTDYVAQNNIAVVRRCSGGGTVYHDMGNVNYTFISTVEQGQAKIDFAKYGQPIIDMLAHYGITAHFDARHSIRIGDLKISGNAEAIHRNRTLHHGCILFDSTLDVLNNAILVDESKYNSRATKSVRTTVTNIREHTNQLHSTDDFMTATMEYIKAQNPTATDYTLTEQDTAQTQKLADEKYKSWDWIYGRSPNYTVTAPWHGADITITVARGKITAVDTNGDNETTAEQGENLAENLPEKLIGQPHQRNALLNNGIPADLIEKLF